MGLKQEKLQIPGYEQVIKMTNADAGLKAIIAIHNTKLGPGLGGTRIHPYKTEEEALTDVLRLSKSMTYKSAIARGGVGGAKSVIIADPKTEKTTQLLYAFAESVNSLEGQYICAEDVGCTPEDVEIILQKSKYACGVYNLRGSGNPAAFTAWGVFCGIKSVLHQLDGTSSLKGKTVAVQGIGNVGKRLLEHLFWAGAELIISDVDPDLVDLYAHKYLAKPVSPHDIFLEDCDILAPCAFGGCLNKETIPALKCRGIAGAANNQLLESEDADRLAKRGILYAPDFVVNGGGLINVLCELSQEGYRAKKARTMTSQIYDQLLEIYEIAQKNSISVHAAAMQLADYRLEHGIGKRVEDLCFRFAPSLV